MIHLIRTEDAYNHRSRGAAIRYRCGFGACRQRAAASSKRWIEYLNITKMSVVPVGFAARARASFNNPGACPNRC